MTNKVVQFEPFKNAQDWDKDYSKFLKAINETLGEKNDAQSLAKRLYYALRFLDGITKAFWLMSKLNPNFDETEIKRGKKYMIGWLEDILEELKEG